MNQPGLFDPPLSDPYDKIAALERENVELRDRVAWLERQLTGKWDSPGNSTARHTDPDTSKAARKEWDGTVRHDTQHHRLLWVARGGDSWPDKEWCRFAKLDLENGSPWKRVSELVQHGYLTPCGTVESEATGKMVRVSRITERGIDRLRELGSPE